MRHLQRDVADLHHVLVTEYSPGAAIGWHRDKAIFDDVIGIWGDPGRTGKPAGADLAAGKKSLPVVAALTSGTAAGAELAAYYGRLPRPTDPAEVERAAEAVDRAGGRDWAQTQVRYFVYAFLYVIFAVDAVYLFPWALVLRSSSLGAVSLVEIAVFIGVLLVGLVHAARRGLLRWL